jgi:hypothetical protein
VSLFHSSDLNNSERGPPKDHFEVKKRGVTLVRFVEKSSLSNLT